MKAVEHPDRYRRQSAFSPLGREGQRRLSTSRATIVGLGALGSMLAERLVRAGVGSLRLIDRDWVELDNLPRQTLYNEADAKQRLPKAIAALNHLKQINSEIAIETLVTDFVPSNAIDLTRESELIIDGTDNFETRFLINDVSLDSNIPWIHGGCVGANGQGLVILPNSTACFRCLIPEPMPPDQQLTCDSAGVLGPAISFIASWQATEAIKILSGRVSDVCRSLLLFDLWDNDVRMVSIAPNRSGDGCPACYQGKREFLSGERHMATQVLCGRNAVQLQSPGSQQLDLVRLGERLSPFGTVSANPFLLRFEKTIDDQMITISVFRDGRGIVAGTEDPIEARKLFAIWIGQ